ncbi:CsgG/HfaB family protein [Chromobacterium sp. IIBBL 290-4]|uniref:CsgG/HfaB family protein n=1 Tax=Chromobacterium sp. IIBBL 290-4 TaxID=2953890 RepID=UPI0020B81915|nr:CsgG/HfaB family protein [Chromobacterium sp. IIBBL 290-4]UTH74716.1 peptidoglycan-binding protein [Chromobacterium sp. IIBBL 290-4]
MDMGNLGAKTVATGSAAGSNAVGANSALEHCPRPLGTLGLMEDTTSPWYLMLTNEYKLPSTVPMLKLLIQQSNCFVVVERGRGMNAMMGERALRESGELRKNSNFGKGKMAAADYALVPTITFSNQDAGSLGGNLAGLLPGALGSVAGAVAGSIHSKEASTLLTLVDNRSSVQIAAAEGSAKNMDFGAVGSLFGSRNNGSISGYSNTPEGKVIVAAFTDAYNNMVKAVKNYKMQTVKGGLGTGGQLKVQ